MYRGVNIKLKCIVMWLGYFLLLQQLTSVPKPSVAPIIANIIGIVYILKILYFILYFYYYIGIIYRYYI
jgi:uncharacterized membrane protein